MRSAETTINVSESVRRYHEMKKPALAEVNAVEIRLWAFDFEDVQYHVSRRYTIEDCAIERVTIRG